MDFPLNKEVICTNWVCTKHGCQKLRDVALPVTANTLAWHICVANPDFACQRQECANGICPPTSEQTCMNPDCGRKARDQA